MIKGCWAGKQIPQIWGSWKSRRSRDLKDLVSLETRNSFMSGMVSIKLPNS